ncbi:proline--tRNA ligase [Alteromonas halophila]|uniref:Proline--tRNA ligase n=1 Tax=Alteromonas halophila TaxID=516698 RepID=A0A918MZ95_9ALTE|nr:proline--tRNA ligase [Alteromonas halophila]GGW86357.1 proline--tRNA ligase [Alteromonas halophila]
MRTSQYLLSTQKETPAEAEIVSHQLMLRAGMIRKLASGLYTWLPTGLKVLNKVAAIVREEMDRAGGVEVLMPVVQPADLWEESGRWDEYGPELLRVKDRHKRDFVLGPTHEEVITSLVRNEINSYKQLPVNLYQVQTKFRDEVRPRFGVMRGREFTMKDAYSFHLTDDCLGSTYQKMYDAYTRMFERMGLEFRAVIADSGAIGGSVSHEFHVLADSGEDAIAFSSGGNFAANVEMAAVPAPAPQQPSGTASSFVSNAGGVEAVCESEGIAHDRAVKLVVVSTEDDQGEKGHAVLVLRRDHTLNQVKAEKLDNVALPLQIASDDAAAEILGMPLNFVNPLDCPLPVIVDHSAAALADFVCGGGEVNSVQINANWPQAITSVDIRNAQAGDPSPDGDGELTIKRGIEVGHIFQLGDKYSKAMNCGVLNESGKHETLTMGCYGIGVSRIVAAAIEQNHDKFGVIWPDPIAPFKVALIPMNMHKSQRIKDAAEAIYAQLTELGIEVLFDDRKERPGVMFNDMELIGIPHSIVVGERNLDNQQVEYKNRRSGEKQLLDVEAVAAFVQQV